MKQKNRSIIRSLKSFSWKKSFPSFGIAAALIGLNASLRLAIDTLELLRNPDYVPACDINPILSCGSVIGSNDGIFSVPHTYLGIMAFTALLVFSVLLLSGARFKEWVWKIGLGASLFGILTVFYLAYESIFVIGALCPWCITIWIATIPLFFGITSYIHQEKLINYAPKRVQQTLAFISKENVLLQTLIFIGIAYAILIKFWYYWSTLL